MKTLGEIARAFAIGAFLALVSAAAALAQGSAFPAPTVGAFVPSGSTSLAASTTSSNTALPGAGNVVVVCNTGSVGAYVALGGSGVTATTSGFYVPPGNAQCVSLNPGSATYVAAITASSSATLQISTGTGAATAGLNYGLNATLTGTTLVPTAAALQFNATTSGGVNWSINPQGDSTATILASSVAMSTFDGVNDWLYNLGWNIYNGSNLINSAKNGIGIQIESDYKVSGSNEGAELHLLNVFAGGGTAVRMFTSNCQYATTTCTTNIEGSPVTIATGDGSATEIAQFNGGSASSLQLVKNISGEGLLLEFTNTTASYSGYTFAINGSGAADGNLWLTGINQGQTIASFNNDWSIQLGQNNNDDSCSSCTVDIRNNTGSAPTLLQVRSTGATQGTNPLAKLIGSTLIGVSAPATTATDGFPYIPAAAGAPTGTPTANSGYVPMLYDSTDHKIWFYDGTWKGVGVS